ncbi:putative MCF.2 cell line derived transforming sequence-like protein [Operophtera brumata]|uniref:Putative MCF.2 cell line derived transforming sequence-like protein n=1 Tax=Operophtera brumata TaxID=104452 RepID=A0A0L7LRV4_OPEBR|nr:putative MCF.2 cell line derived transforming sequence-like protein [Operophtera brumata]
MTEVGETAGRVENLIQEANDFEILCNCDLGTASSVIEDGDKLMQDPLSSVDHIESKCEELRRTSTLLIDKIQKRNTLLTKARVEILAGEGGLIAVDKLLEDAQTFGLTAPEEFREMLMQSATQETRALVTQRASLQRAMAKPARPVQSVPPQSAIVLSAANQRASLQRAMAKPARPVQSVPPQSAIVLSAANQVSAHKRCLADGVSEEGDPAARPVQSVPPQSAIVLSAANQRASLQRAMAKPARPVQSVPPQSAIVLSAANQEPGYEVGSVRRIQFLGSILVKYKEKTIFVRYCGYVT